MMTTNSKAKELLKTFDSNNNHRTHNPYEFFSISAIEDELTYILSSKNECQVNKETNQIIVRWKYLDNAEWILYRINVFRPIPKFEINRLDIPQMLEEILSNLDKESVNIIFTNVVRRILESVNPIYYHTNGVHGKVRWRIID